MNNIYQQFMRNSQNGLPVEVSLVASGLPGASFSVCLEGEYSVVTTTAPIMAYIRLDPPTGRLLTHFLRASITGTCHQAHFRQNAFTCSGQTLSPGVVEALGWKPGNYHLAKGQYPILADADFYTVSARIGKPVYSSLPALPMTKA